MKIRLRYPLFAAMLAMVLFAVSCGSSYQMNESGGTTSGGTTAGTSPVGVSVKVVMKNIKFDPDNLTVNAGTTVTWTNEDAVQHNVTSDDGLFDSGNLGKGDTFSYTFDKPGTYEYHCTLHPPNMKGTVVVN